MWRGVTRSTQSDAWQLSVPHYLYFNRESKEFGVMCQQTGVQKHALVLSMSERHLSFLQMRFFNRMLIKNYITHSSTLNNKSGSNSDDVNLTRSRSCMK